MYNIIYDIETYPNLFTCAVLNYETQERLVYEISDRCNDLPYLTAALYGYRDAGARMVGFTNIGFDYPVLHFILTHGSMLTVESIYDKAMSIINAPYDQRFNHVIWPNKWVVEQLDLFKIHHFDNVARATSLKVIAYNRRSPNIMDLPYLPGTVLTYEQMDHVRVYNMHDVDETAGFFEESMGAIEFREELTAKYNRNFMNHNDTKIGKDYFIMRLEEEGVHCYFKDPVSGRRKPRQTPREKIPLRDVIFPYVYFDDPEFRRVHRYLWDTTLTQTKGAFDGLSATVDGFTFDFGTGGIHGSVDPCIVTSDDANVIVDVDVTSYYPSLAIANRVYPEHLSEKFCDIYTDVKSQRVGYAKGTPENKMLKLALNGVYGDSNNQYGPFYDPCYTMAITVNGQLLLCMLAEKVMQIPGLRMIQINTDGLTVKLPRVHKCLLDAYCRWWEQLTGLELEEAIYDRMFIRDVNNYIAEYEDASGYKLKGAYLYNRAHHQNQSQLVVPMAAEAALVHCVDIEDFVRNHPDNMDFMLRTKVPRSSRLEWGNEVVQNITRYYISETGRPLTKVMPPLKGKDKERRIGVNVGHNVMVCNHTVEVDRDDVDYDYYITEARKLVDPLINGGVV